MRRLGLLYLLLSISAFAFGQRLKFESLREINPGGGGYFDDGEFDEDGNFYLYGACYPDNDFDPDPNVVVSVDNVDSNGDIFIAKYAPDGALIWVKSFSGFGYEDPYKIDVDASGNVYAVGAYTSSPLDLNPDSFGELLAPNYGPVASFVVKLDSDGNFVWGDWIASTSVSEDAYITDVVAADDGGVSFTGTFSGSLFVFNYNSAGAYLDSFLIPCGGQCGGGNIFRTGNYLLVTGTFSNSVNVDPLGSGAGQVSGSGTTAFFTFYDATTLAWAGGTRLIDGADEVITDAHVTDAGDIYLTGAFASTFNQAGTTLSSNGSYDVFIMKYTTGPNFAWAKSFGGPYDDWSLEMDVDADDNVYLAGYMYQGGWVDIDPDPVETHYVYATEDDYDGFLLKLDSDGNFVAGNIVGTSSTDFVASIAVDPNGDVMAVGGFSDYAAVDIDPSYATVSLKDGNFGLIRFTDGPIITGAFPSSAAVGATVDIYGYNFSPVDVENNVAFGATRANVISASRSVLSVEIPPSSSFDPISVMVNGLSATTPSPVNVTFEFYGKVPDSYASEVDYAVGGLAGRAEVSDLDNDGKPDLIVASPDQNQVVVFQNQSSVASIDESSFVVAANLSTGGGNSTLAVAVGDLNGDGLNDIVATQPNAGAVAVYLNTSTAGAISFDPPVSYVIGGIPRAVEIHDLDRDGKPEIIAGTNLGTVAVFENHTLPSAALDLTQWQYFELSDPIWDLAAGDLDGDGWPEIAIISDGYFLIYGNTLYANGFQTGFTTAHSEAGGGSALALADLDGDALLDIIKANRGGTLNGLYIYENNSTPGNYSFSSTAPGFTSLWPVEIGDIDGDGKPDIVTAENHPSAAPPGKVIVLKNKIETSYLVNDIDATKFEVDEITVGGRPLDISIVDLDGDARNDLIISDEFQNVLSVRRNLNTTAPPADQPSELEFTEMTSHSLRTEFNPAPSAPDGYIVIRRDGDTELPATPQDGVAYPVGYVFPEDGSVVVYSGNQPFFNASGLSGSATFSVFAFNGAYNAVSYNTVDPLTSIAYLPSNGTSLSNAYFHRASSIGSVGFENIDAISVGLDGFVYAAGSYEDGSMDFDPGPGFFDVPKFTVGQDVWLAQYNREGELQWARSIVSTDGFNESAQGIGVDGGGNVYVLGKFTYDISASGLLAYSMGGEDLFIAKYDAAGVPQWVRTIGSSFDDDEYIYRNGFKVDDAGNVYVAGEFSGTAYFDQFGAVSRTASGERDMFVAMYSTQGDLLWVRQIGGPGSERSRDLALTPFGDVVFIGQGGNGGSVSVEGGEGTLEIDGESDVIFGKFDAFGNLYWAQNVGGPFSEYGEGITVDPDGSIYITGTYNSLADFDPTSAGVNYVTSASPWLDETFLAKYSTDGSLQWVKSMNANNHTYGIRVKSDGIGGVYVTGIVTGSVNADGNSGVYSIAPMDGVDIVLYRYSTDGFLRWSGIIGGFGDDYVADLDVTPDHDVIVVGNFAGQVFPDPNDGGVSITGAGGTDPMMIKFGPLPADDVAGAPGVSLVTPISGPPGSFVTIHGANFDPEPANNIVYFGATQAIVTSASDSQIEVQVPVGATYDEVTVTVRGRTAAYRTAFVPTYISTGTMDASSFESKVTLSANEPGHVRIADLDGDGKPDLVVTNGSFNSINVAYNESEPENIDVDNYIKNIFVGTNPVDVELSDLDGDGKIDIVVSNASSASVSILRNRGGRLFAPPVHIHLGTVDAGDLVVGDINRDGRPDIAVASPSSNAVVVLRNLSAPGAITRSSFVVEPNMIFSSPPSGVAFGRFMGNDEADDLAVSLPDEKIVVVLAKQSVGGPINPGDFVSTGHATGPLPTDLLIADLDGDHYGDVIANITDAGNPSLSIFENQQTSLGFETSISLSEVTSTFTVGDLTGDGFPDIVTSSGRALKSLGDPDLTNGAYEEIAFFSEFLVSNDVQIADIDGDGKSDLVFSDPDNGGVSILRNTMTFGPPTVQASGLEMTLVSDFGATVSFTPGNGNRHLLVVKQGETVDATPVDGEIYESTWLFPTEGKFPTAHDLGNGNFVLASGANDWITLGFGDLAPATQYAVAIFAFNDLAGEPSVTTENSMFLTDLTGVTQNPISFFTLDTEPQQHPELSLTAMGTTIRLGFNSPAAIGADGYVILRRSDGTAADGTGIADGGGEEDFILPGGTTLVGVITDPDAVQYLDNELAEFATYHYTLVPFNWLAGVPATRNYLLTGTLATGSATTTDLADEPLNSPTGPIGVTNITTSGYTITFDAAADNPTGYLVVRKEGVENFPTFVPLDQVTYTVGSEIEVGSGEVVAYVGSALQFDETALIAGSPYSYRIYSFNGDGTSINYRTIDFLEGTAQTRVAEPLNIAGNFAVTDRTTTSLSISFDVASDNPDGYLVVRKAGTDPTVEPVDGTSYALGEIETGSEEFVVFVGAAPSSSVAFDDTGLLPGTTYHYKVYSYNGSGELNNYLTSMVLSGSATTTPEPPTVQASGLTAINRAIATAQFGFTSGNGNRRMAVMKSGNSIDATPVDGTTYSADGSLLGGSALANDNHVVAIIEQGATGFEVSGLSGGVQYTVALFEFNDVDFDGGSSTAQARYLTDLTGTNQNPISFYTIAQEPIAHPSTFDATAFGTTIKLEYPVPATVQANGYLILRTEAPDFPNIAALADGTASVPPGSTLVAMVSGATTEHNDLGLTPGVTYNYTIIPYNQVDGISETINYFIDGSPGVASATTSSIADEPESPPSNFDVDNETANGFTVSFNPSTTGADGYIAIRRVGELPATLPVDGMVYEKDDAISSGEVVAFVGTTADDPVVFTETGLQDDTEYHYRIYAFNGSNATTNYLTAVPLGGMGKTLVADREHPEVVDNTQDLVPAGSSVTITAQITDESGIIEAKVYVRPLSTDDSFVPKDLVSNGDTYTAQVSSNEIGELGIEYYFDVTDAAGNVFNLQDSQTPGKVRVQHPNDGLTIPYNSHGSSVSNYRIVAIPLDLEAKSMSNVFVDDLGSYDKKKWRMFRYQGGSTVELAPSTQIDAGKGYWLIVKDPGNTIDSGPGNAVATSDQGFNIPVTSGWNQIGNPYNYNISWQDVIDANPGMSLPDFVRVYNTGTFTDGSRLNKFEGGFINLGNGGNLLIPRIKNSSVNREGFVDGRQLNNSIDEADWEVRFEVTQGDLKNLISGVGMRANASEGFDRYDGFSMPRFIAYLDVNHNKAFNGSPYSMDIVPTAPTHVWEFSVDSEGTGPVTIYWENAHFANSGKSLILWDVNLQLGIDMKSATRYEFDPATSTAFKVIYGHAEFADEITAVHSLVFHHVRPNPVSNGEEALIAFTTPDSGPVLIELMDITGKQVDVVFEGTLEAGYHEVAYEGFSHPAGVYITRIRAGKVTAHKRTVLSH